jgi:biopolymer transport protein ExbD
MRLKASHQPNSVIPTASMADIAFLLIVFFMVTFTAEVDRAQVSLPKTMLRVEVPKQAAYISITEAGVIRVSGGEEISTVVPGVEDVVSFAASVVANQPNKEFIIKADSNVPYRTVDRVIDALKQSRVPVIYLLSQQETVERGSTP